MSKSITERYDSVREALDAAEKNANTSPSSASHKRGDSWSGGTWAEAISKGRDGWSDARPQVDAILEPVRERLAELLSDHPDRIHDMCGFEPDIDRYIAGELECMFDEIVVPQIKTGKVFTILVASTVSSGVAPETILKRGAAIVALVEAFQMLGCDLNIYVENSVGVGWRSKGSDQARILTRVHDAGENLDINNIMFPLGHPGWLRRIIFGIQEGWPPNIREAYGIFPEGGGYGSCIEGTTFDDELDVSFVMNMGASSHDQDCTDPVAWVLQQLHVQGLYDFDVED